MRGIVVAVYVKSLLQRCWDGEARDERGGKEEGG
jgi:hypothetical protein